MKNKLKKHQNKEIQNERRKFISKFGKLAAVTPVAVTVLMSTHSSKAMASELEEEGPI